MLLMDKEFDMILGSHGLSLTSIFFRGSGSIFRITPDGDIRARDDAFTPSAGFGHFLMDMSYLIVLCTLCAL